MKKFTTVFMTLLIMLVAVLTGCAGFSIDKVKYYNEVLAKVGDETITRFDLVNAYNNYGYTNYVTQAGQSQKEALMSTMKSLVQRKMMFDYARQNAKYALSEYEISKMYRDTIDALLESFDEYKQKARQIYDLEAKEAGETEDSAESIKLSDYNYTKRVKIVNGQIKYDINNKPEEEVVKPSIDEDFVTKFKNYSNEEIISALRDQFETEFYANNDKENVSLYNKVCKKAIELACNNLINYEYYLREDGKKLSTNQEDLLYRFVERVYTSQLESAYITKVNTVYLESENLSNNSLINAFKANYERDFAKYDKDAKAYYEDVIATDGDLIYYTPESDAEFGYFLHVLLPFNNVEKDLNRLKDLYLGKKNTQAYRDAQMALVYQIECAQRTTEDVYDTETDELLYEEGVVLEDTVSINIVLDEYEQNVKDLVSFKEFMFKYTTDTATLTADMPYIIGYNTKTNDTYSSMVKNFTNEAVRLMKENKRYTGSKDFILTNYGVHLLYYVGPVENQISAMDINKVTVEKLDSMVLNKATGETYLDRIFDLVYPANSDGMFTSNTKYSDYETKLVESLYSQYDVTLYETKIKASNKI